MTKHLLALILVLVTQQSLANTVTAKAWLVADAAGQVIDSSNSSVVRPIASITKLVTAMVVLDANQPLAQMIPLSQQLEDALPRDKVLSRREVLYLALVKSDNRAALTLCEQYPGGLKACVIAMNRKMIDLGMQNSRVVEPTGLDVRNVSTADDLARLVLATKGYPDIVDASQTASVDIRTPIKQVVGKRNRRRWVTVERTVSFQNTNPLVRNGGEAVVISKTGFTNPAGGCIALLMNNRVVIILGSKNTHTRIPEAQLLSRLSI